MNDINFYANTEEELSSFVRQALMSDEDESFEAFNESLQTNNL